MTIVYSLYKCMKTSPVQVWRTELTCSSKFETHVHRTIFHALFYPGKEYKIEGDTSLESPLVRWIQASPVVNCGCSQKWVIKWPTFLPWPLTGADCLSRAEVSNIRAFYRPERRINCLRYTSADRGFTLVSPCSPKCNRYGRQCEAEANSLMVRLQNRMRQGNILLKDKLHTEPFSHRRNMDTYRKKMRILLITRMTVHVQPFHWYIALARRQLVHWDSLSKLPAPKHTNGIDSSRCSGLIPVGLNLPYGTDSKQQV